MRQLNNQPKTCGEYKIMAYLDHLTNFEYFNFDWAKRSALYSPVNLSIPQTPDHYHLHPLRYLWRNTDNRLQLLEYQPPLTLNPVKRTIKTLVPGCHYSLVNR